MCVVQARSQGGGGGWGVNPQKSLHKKLWVYIWLFWQTSITNSTKDTTAKYGNGIEATVHCNDRNYFIVFTQW